MQPPQRVLAPRIRIRWQRLRIVAGSRDGCVTTSISTVRGGGSSRVFRSALAAKRFNTSAGENHTDLALPALVAGEGTAPPPARGSAQMRICFGLNRPPPGCTPRPVRMLTSRSVLQGSHPRRRLGKPVAAQPRAYRESTEHGACGPLHRRQRSEAISLFQPRNAHRLSNTAHDCCS